MLNPPPIPTCKISPLQTVFEDVLLDQLKKEDGETRRFPLSPSTALSCRRRLQYDICNYYQADTIPASKFSGRQRLIFKMGHMIEELLAGALSKVPNLKVIENKQRFEIYKTDEMSITGEIDRILIDEQTGDKYLWDAKGINTHSFKEIKESLTPKDGNYFQQQMYLGSDFIKNQGITKGILHYKNKDTSEFLMLEFDYNEEHAKWGVQTHLDTWEATKKHQIYSRDYLLGRDWQCKALYCPYHSYCYSTLYSGDKVLKFEADPVLDRIIKAGLHNDRKFEVLDRLLSYGDYREYHYENWVFEVQMFKTTIGLKWKQIKSNGKRTYKGKQGSTRSQPRTSLTSYGSASVTG